MSGTSEMPSAPHAESAELLAVDQLIREALRLTPLGRSSTAGVAAMGGKRLRARLTLSLAPAAGAAPDIALRAAAAIEMVHAASLLHDDVIDGGQLRRSQPSFWAQYGIQGAILSGDLLLCEALRLLRGPEAAEYRTRLIELSGEMCAVETEQELFLRGHPRNAATVERLARGKTGSLFAFAAWAAAAPDRPDLAAALLEAGYLAGTIYQISDDVLDGQGMESAAGKTLGTDAARSKLTAAAATESDRRTLHARLAELNRQADAQLAPWPLVKAAWDGYQARDFRPAVSKNLSL